MPIPRPVRALEERPWPDPSSCVSVAAVVVVAADVGGLVLVGRIELAVAVELRYTPFPSLQHSTPVALANAHHDPFAHWVRVISEGPVRFEVQIGRS